MFKFLPKTEKAHRHAKDIDLTKGPRFTKDAPVKDDSINEELKRVASLASECLEHVSFKKYADSMLKIETELTNDLMSEAIGFEKSGKSIEMFGSYVLAKLLKLYTTKSLLLAVRKDVARGGSVSDEKEDK